MTADIQVTLPTEGANQSMLCLASERPLISGAQRYIPDVSAGLFRHDH
jgi:hypothetical protein